MSAFTPTYSSLEPKSRPDNLSAAVLHSLSRPIYGRVAWGPVRSFVLGAITFGIAPLIAWPRQFGRFVMAEQQQFWHLFEWLRIRTGDPEAAKLRDSVRHTGAMPSLWIIPLFMLLFLALNFIPWINATGFAPDPYLLHRIFDATYAATPWPMEHLFYGHRFHYFNHWSSLFKIWTICLSVGYFSHWLHVRHHLSSVNDLLRGLNVILARQQLPPVAMFGVGIGLRPLWLLAGFIGFTHGAIWAIPAALAGAVHQRYVRRTSARIRGELAMRVNAALNRQRPPIDVPMPHGFRAFCRNSLCGQTLPSGAGYCPRCGTRIPAADAVA